MPLSIVYKYPLDLTGVNPDNRAINEKHTIGTVKGRIFIADYGPFFGNNLIVRETSTGVVLKPVIDYVLIHQVREAQESTGQPIYCGIRIVNPDISTGIEIDVSYIGGEFSYTTRVLLSMLDEIIADDRPIEWGELIGVPNEWNPTPHLHSAYDLYAMKHLVGSTMDVSSAIREGHIANSLHLFQMVSDRIAVFEDIVPTLIDCFERGEAELATLL